MGSKKNRKIQHGDVVVCTAEFCGMRTPPRPTMGKLPPASELQGTIPTGVMGLYHGFAQGVSPEYGLYDIEFEIEPGVYARVETPVENFQLV